MDDQPVSWIVRGDRDRHPIAEDDADAEASHAAAEAREEGVSSVRLHGEIAASQDFDHGAIDLY